jgi:hypothetical protein
MIRTAVHRESVEAPCSPPAADSKCKEMIPFYCSSLANPVRLRRTTGNALALLNRVSSGKFNRASCSIFKHGTQAQTGGISEICLGLAKAGSEPAYLALAREQTALALSA